MRAVSVVAIVLAVLSSSNCASARPHIAPGIYDVVWNCTVDGCTTTTLELIKIHRRGWADAHACARRPDGRFVCGGDVVPINWGQALWLQPRRPAIAGAPPTTRSEE